MSAEENTRLVQSAYEAFGRGDMAAFAELMADDILSPGAQERARERLEAWVAHHIAKHLAPLLALAVEADSRTCQVIQASGAFAVSVYESGQRELAGLLGRRFAKHPEKLDSEMWQPGPETGSPVLAATMA